MKNFFRNQYDKILVLMAVVFLVGLTIFYVWGARFLVVGFNRTTEIKGGPEDLVHFDVGGAAKLNLVH
ncbi:MAG: hypothetical protein HY093_03485 [Candidatus Liptonbacteria bacterium]|nr:hypothetical protein [Candidatus Liptonbacteria bacterium]